MSATSSGNLSMGILDTLGLQKLAKGLAKTREGLVEKVARLVSLHPAPTRRRWNASRRS